MLFLLIITFIEIGYLIVYLDVYGSVHRNIKLIERTNKIQPCSRIYYSDIS